MGKYDKYIQDPEGTEYLIKDIEQDGLMDDGVILVPNEAKDGLIKKKFFGEYLDDFGTALGNVSSGVVASPYEPAPLVSTFGRLNVENIVDQMSTQFFEGVLIGETRNEILVGDTTVEIANDTLLRLSANVGTASQAYMETFRRLRYYPGHEFGMWFTILSENMPQESGEFVTCGLGDQENGIFVEARDHEGVMDWGILIRRNSVETFLPRGDFYDQLDGTGPSGINLQVDKGNIFLLKGGYLGFAPLKLYIMDSKGRIYFVHAYEYPNSHNQTHIGSARLPISAEVSNGAGNHTVELMVGSFSAFTIGGDSSINNRYYTRTRTGTLNTNTSTHDYNPIVAFRPTQTFQGLYLANPVKNYIPAILREVQAIFASPNKVGVYSIHLVPASAVTATNWAYVEQYGSSLEIADNITGATISVDWTGLDSEKNNPVVSEPVGTGTAPTAFKDGLEVKRLDLEYPLCAVVCYTSATSTAVDVSAKTEWLEEH